MKNPFKIGDTVHHVFYGQGKVIDPKAPNHKKENGRTVLVEFEECIRQYAPSELSFNKWPAPVHTPPLTDGVYIVHILSGEPVVRIRENGSWYKIKHNMKPVGVVQGGDSLYTIIKKVG